jgi:dephospho-CoA kinase
MRAESTGVPGPPQALDAAILECCREISGRLFPWDSNRALELALLKTFCLPSISGLLQRTGEFEERPRKRYDDTGLMLAELVRLGPDSPGGQAVIQRLNRIHGHYAISNADFLYVLSGFVAEPIRWMQHYGWRALNPMEQQALFRFWDHVGALMGISNRPTNLEALLALNARVEREDFRPETSNRQVADATVAMLLSGVPPILRRPAEEVLRGLLEPELLQSLGWKPAPRLLAVLVRSSLRFRSRLVNLQHLWWPPRQQCFYSERPTPSYGPQFSLKQLGPPPMLERLNQPRWSGRQRRIGLTGGIATGKSSVSRWLAKQGLPILDADVFARDALAPGTPGAKTVLARHGDCIRQAGSEPTAHHIDRAALGRIVFQDPRERRWLEDLVHPLVKARFRAELTKLLEAPDVVLVIPLLFEAHLEELCSEVWLVDCEPEQQLQRLMKRDGISEGEAVARIDAQWPLQKKRELADRIITNNGSIEDLEQQLAKTVSHFGQHQP